MEMLGFDRPRREFNLAGLGDRRNIRSDRPAESAGHETDLDRIPHLV